MRQQFLWIAGCCSIIIWAGTQTWAYQDETPQPVGLSGLMAAYAPDGLSPADFEDLSEEIDESWKEWTLETGQFVTDFYEGENDTLEAQETALKRVRVKLNTMEKALGDSRYRSIHDQIGPLYSSLIARVDMAEAVLETLTIDEETALKVRTQAATETLKSALADFRRDMNSVRGGQAWLKWAKSNELQNFRPSNEESIEAVNKVKAQLETREEYGDEIREFMSRESFLQLEDALAAVQAAVAPVSPEAQIELREQLGMFLETVDEYYDEPSPELAASLREQFDAIRLTAPDGGEALSSAFAVHFLNYNLRLAISEGLLNKVIGETRNESSQINDYIMGARVVGNQNSNVNLSVNIQPSTNEARFELNLNGVVRTNSFGSTSQATIQTTGYHTFNAVKSIGFDGNEFSTRPASVSVRANNRPVGARTRFSGGLFGGIADRIAMREASARMGQANGYTQRSIQEEVSSELNREVDSRFAEASMELQNRLYGPLREYGLYPDAIKYSSTSSQIHGSTRLANPTELGGGRPDPGIKASSKGILVQVHETLLSNGSNRLELGTEGKQKLSDGELREMIEERLSKILDREVDLGEPDESSEGTMFVFDEPNPIRFQIIEGEVILTIRAGLDRGEEGSIPTQIITVPLSPSVVEDKVILTRGNVGVKPVERPSNVAEQVARANVMRQKIQASLPEQEIDAVFELEQEGKIIKLRITSIVAESGWLSLNIE
ncbi:hypothetical protein AB1L42_15830 [Thalassoglobus sp. JC818]|uniref:hypothetical protein n=1 Tax=Thalassoglobus sp. JC818 TaxID=3232136 RepID=UPI0034592042